MLSLIEQDVALWVQVFPECLLHPFGSNPVQTVRILLEIVQRLPVLQLVDQGVSPFRRCIVTEDLPLRHQKRTFHVFQFLPADGMTLEVGNDLQQQ